MAASTCYVFPFRFSSTNIQTCSLAGIHHVPEPPVVHTQHTHTHTHTHTQAVSPMAIHLFRCCLPLQAGRHPPRARPPFHKQAGAKGRAGPGGRCGVVACGVRMWLYLCGRFSVSDGAQQGREDPQLLCVHPSLYSNHTACACRRVVCICGYVCL